jgi:hypothetical protein
LPSFSPFFLSCGTAVRIQKPSLEIILDTVILKSHSNLPSEGTYWLPQISREEFLSGTEDALLQR